MASEWFYAFKAVVAAVSVVGFTAFMTPLSVNHIEGWRDVSESRLEQANEGLIRVVSRYVLTNEAEIDAHSLDKMQSATYRTGSNYPSCS